MGSISVTRQPECPMPYSNDSQEDMIQKFAHWCSTTRNQVEDIYPCSPLQHGLFAASTKSTGCYTAQHRFKLHEATDVTALKRAWNAVIESHSILRTCIVLTASAAVQVVLKSWVPSWSDCSDMNSYLGEDMESPFESGNILSRFAISQDHVVWTAHHAIYDSISLEMIIHDVSTAYFERALPPRKPFRNFIRHLAVHNKGKTVEHFWQNMLPSREIFHFPHSINNNQHRCIKTCQRHATLPNQSPLDVTAATILQAAWGLVISGQLSTSTPSWGTTLSGRNLNISGIEQIVGPTIATIPVCFCLCETSSVSEYLQTVQKYFIDVASFQHFGLQNIRAVSPEAEIACQFENLFVVQPPQIASGTGTVSAPMYLITEDNTLNFSQYSLVVQCFLSAAGEFGVTASFDSEVLPEARVERVLAQLEHVCRELLSSRADRKLRDINLVSGEDMLQLHSWNEAVKRSPELPLNEFNRHCQMRGAAEAVSSWDGQLTYRQLDDLSSHLAGVIIAKFGIGVEQIVPICIERSLLLVISIIATLKAGAAFCLLDSNHPKERLFDIIRQTGAKIMISSETQQYLFSGCAIEVVVVNSLCASTPQSSESLESLNSISLSPKNMMYLVFTSGSTGKPKGVIVTHGSFFSSALASDLGHIHKFGLSPESRVLHFSSPAFDLCVLEIVSTLMAGGCVCIPSEIDRLSDIGTAITSLAVSHASFTSTTARFIDPSQVPTLKTLGLVGEPLAKDMQQLWADKVRLLNGYGPSECSVISTIHSGITSTGNPANIGRVVVGTGWVVRGDDHDRLVPIGAIGELLIDGPHVGRGYLNDSTATEAAFIENPVWLKPELYGKRWMYKTGDLVRQDTDGSFVFEGRKDRQVKLHGQRIEIDEIEFHLTKLFPNASGVAVELWVRDTHQQLVCFIFDDRNPKADQRESILRSLSEQEIVTILDIKSYLLRVLPRNFIPSRYLLWPQSPTLSSGKLDRKALQRELDAPTGIALEFHLPETQMSALRNDDMIVQQLSQKIAGLLGLRESEERKTFEGHDAFLSHLGMNSIQLIALINYCRHRFGIKLSIATLYDEKLTVTGLAQLIRDHKESIETLKERDITVIDLMHEVEEACERLTSLSIQGTRTVFLTGAAGYLGSEILRQLVQCDKVKRIIVHVRASSTDIALARIESAAKLGGWWSPIYLKRIECWLGDLSLPQLGLSSQQWQILEGDCEWNSRIQDVILCGAAVQWQAPYSALRATNVQSVVAVLGAMSQWGHSGSITYVSGGVKRLPHQDTISFANGLKTTNGYSQSKFVAEEVMARFAKGQRSNRIRSSIVRPGWIIGTAAEGVPNTDDFLWKFVQTCVAVKVYPSEHMDSWLAVAPVDEVARSVLNAAFGDCEVSKDQIRVTDINITDINTGIQARKLWDLVQVALGAGSLKPVTSLECRAEIACLMNNATEAHTFRPLLAMIEDDSHHIGIDMPLAYREQSEQAEQALLQNIQNLKSIGFFKSTWATSMPVSKSSQLIPTSKRRAFHRSTFIWGKQTS